MALFDKILKKQAPSKRETFTACVEGSLIDIREVNDPAFSQEMLGRSVAIEPECGMIKSPCDGEISTVFATEHAIGILTKTGAELLIHVGIDTVNLNGEHFEALVKDGDKVSSGQSLLAFEPDKIREKGYSPVTIVIITNSDEFQTFEKMQPTKVTYADVVLTIEK